MKNVYILKHNDHATISLRTIPTGNIFLYFFCCEKALLHNNASGYNHIQNGIYLSGLQKKVADQYVNEGIGSVIVFELSPDTIYSLFGISQSGITSKFFKLEDLIGYEGRQLSISLAEETDSIRQIEIIAEFISSLAESKKCNRSSIISEAVLAIQESNGALPVGLLADRLCFSVRKLERIFKQVIGIGPKSYCRIIQFNTAFTYFVTDKMELADVISCCGYYDQAHFCNHFKEVLGISPWAFFNNGSGNVYIKKVGKAERCYRGSFYQSEEGLNKLYIF